MPAGNWTCGAACSARSNRPARCRRPRWKRSAASCCRCAETASHYIRLRGAQNQLAVLRQTLDNANRNLALTRLRQREGVATELDVSQADAQAAAIEAAVPLALRVDQLMNALALLLDQPPPHAARAAGNAGAHPGRSGAGAGGLAQRAGRAASRHPPGAGAPACRGGRDRRGRGRFLSAHHPVGQHRAAGAATGQPTPTAPASSAWARRCRSLSSRAASCAAGCGCARRRPRRQRWHSRKPCSAPGTMSTMP